MINNVNIKYNGLDQLCCPECGDVHGHMRSISELACEYGMGARIIIEGECGHIWRVRLVPWKGTLIIRCEYNEECQGFLGCPDNLEWRKIPFGVQDKNKRALPL